MDYNDYYSLKSKNYNDIRLDLKEDFNNTISIITHNVLEHSTILDIGCGTGKYGERLNALNYIVKGIDKSKSQVFEACKIIDAQEADASFIPFASCSFDACLMIMMIQQLDSTERHKAFSEVFRVLKPGGKLIIKTASHNDISKRFSSIYFPSACKEDLERYPSIETIKNELCNEFYVSIISSVVESQFKRDDYAKKLLQRRTSNLRNISDEELMRGVEKFLKEFELCDTIQKKKYNTFIIAEKKRNDICVV